MSNEEANFRQIAALLIEQHGPTRALSEAQRRASHALAQGDLRSHATWLSALDYCRLPLHIVLGDEN
jgi:hypothetical protein